MTGHCESFGNDVESMCWRFSDDDVKHEINFNQVELLIRLQTQRARDSEFNTTSVVIAQPVDETAATTAGQQITKKELTNGQTVQD